MTISITAMATSFIRLLQKTANDIVERLKESFKEKDMIATGKTVNSLRYEVNEKGFQIWGADWIEFSEYGRGPARNKTKTDFLERLLEWARARGFPEWRVEFLKWYINRFGTRLYRGDDPRFSGKQSGVITDVINDELIEEIKTIFVGQIITDFKNQLRESTT